MSNDTTLDPNQSEVERITIWAMRAKNDLENRIRITKGKMTRTRNQAKKASYLPDKLTLIKKAEALEQQLRAQRMSLFDDQDAIDTQAEDLLSALQKSGKV